MSFAALGTALLSAAVAAPSPAPPAMAKYCPQEVDFDSSFYSDDSGVEGSVTFAEDGAFTVTGGGQVNGRASFNLLGGYISFDFDTSKVQNGVNTNLYTISPTNGIEESGYCDIQDNGSPQCMEMDILEANGNCVMATTWHTSPDLNGGCGMWGCSVMAPIKGVSSIKASFSADGFMTTFLNGEALTGLSPYPDSGATAVVKDTMESIGAAIWSSQWQGWAPGQDQCNAYNGMISKSSYTVRNLRVFGAVVQGDAPTLCDVQDDDGDDAPADDGKGGDDSKGDDSGKSDDDGADCAAAYGQCGGATWDGPTCCVAGYTCEVRAPPRPALVPSAP